jgi:hypothetical protein
MAVNRTGVLILITFFLLCSIFSINICCSGFGHM